MWGGLDARVANFIVIPEPMVWPAGFITMHMRGMPARWRGIRCPRLVNVIKQKINTLQLSLTGLAKKTPSSHNNKVTVCPSEQNAASEREQLEVFLFCVISLALMLRPVLQKYIDQV